MLFTLKLKLILLILNPLRLLNKILKKLEYKLIDLA
jgi:hypothetical protein